MIKDINLIINNGQGIRLDTPTVVNNTILVNAGQNAEYLGVLTLHLSRDGNIISFDGKTMQLDDKIETDVDMKHLTDEYHAVVLEK